MRNNPPLPAIANAVCIRLTNTFTMQSQLYEIIQDYLSSGPVALSPALMAAFLGAWNTTNSTLMLACMSQNINLTQQRVADVNPSTTPTLVSNPTPAPGTVTSDPLPGTVAVVLTKRTNVKGQHGRGRIYMPGVPISFSSPGTDPNKVNASGITAYNNFLVSMLVPFVAGGVSWIWSVTTRPVTPVVIVTNAAPVTLYTVESIFGTVRRRREGRGI